MNPNRVLVIGASGAGKTAVARRVADRLALPFVASDHFYWGPRWAPTTSEEVARLVAAVVNAKFWVLDGNFDQQRRVVWPRADLIVWLDPSLTTIATNIIGRNVGWWARRKATWSGNTMSLRRAWSGVHHAIGSVDPKRRSYPVWLGELGLCAVRLRSRREIAAWLGSLPDVSLGPVEPVGSQGAG